MSDSWKNFGWISLIAAAASAVAGVALHLHHKREEQKRIQEVVERAVREFGRGHSS